VDKYLSGTFLEVQEPHTYITVAWCKISLPWVKASNLKEFLTQWWVHVLPGTYFFWNDHSLGESYIRIALARNADVFEQSMAHLRIWLEKFESLYHQNKLTHE
jgi:aspartate/methionine/tyrosine aminotransferase